MTGNILAVEGVMLLLPLLCSLIYGEKDSVFSFLITALITLAVGLSFSLLLKTKNRNIFAREGFAIVALSWITMSLFGALPFVISGAIPSYVDAFFETVSGFTTTGATILSGSQIEGMSHGLLLWRSFTHWIGGMGVLVFVMAIFPSESGRSIHIMRAEVPGPIVGKLVPKIRETAKILYLIYVGLTVLMTVFLLLGGMSFYESIVHSFATAGTGGFGIKADSIGGYSPYIQWVVAIFMLLFGVNFNLFYLILIGKVRSALKSSELWIYFGIIALATFAIGINVANLFDSFGDTLRHSIFQVAAIITTTGFSTTDFTVWPEFSKMVIIVLMFIGGMAGSTAGGLKISRIMILFKTVRRDLKKMLHPRSIGVIKQEGKTVEDETIANTSIYIVVYFIIFFISMLLISFEPFGLETSFSSVASCINNIGPAYGAAASNFSCYSDFSTIVLSVVMLLGRLEIFPLLLAFAPSTWLKK
jgi:trk system potassium uptake protein TrkH